MARDFDRVFARVGVRGSGKTAASTSSITPVALGYRTVMHRVAVCLGERPPAPEYPVADGEGFSAADADDGDSPSGGRLQGRRWYRDRCSLPAFDAEPLSDAEFVGALELVPAHDLRRGHAVTAGDGPSVSPFLTT